MMDVYLDNGATTKVADEVIDAMLPFMKDDYGNESSLHRLGRDAKKALEKSRKMIADSLNAEPEEIIFTSGGTEANNFAIKGRAFIGEKKHIIISAVEHDCILEAGRWLEKQGFRLTVLPVDKMGIVDPKDLEAAITPDTVIVSIMHANNEIGTILPIKEYAAICRKHDVIFHTDACQSYTKVPIDVKEMDLDMVTINSHKIHGPKGVGALFIRKGVKVVPLFHGGGHEFKKRSGTINVAGIVGFAEAVRISSGYDLEYMKEMRDYLIDSLLKIPHTHLNGPKEGRLSNNASVSFHLIEGEGILMGLDIEGICVSTGSACSSNSLEPSHVLMAIGLPHETAHGTIRFTLSRYTTKEEIDYTIKMTEKVVKRLRAMSPLLVR